LGARCFRNQQLPTPLLYCNDKVAQFWAGFVTDGHHVSIQVAVVGYDVTSDISSTLKGGLDVILVDILNVCQTNQGTKCSGGHSIWVEMFCGHSVAGHSVEAPCFLHCLGDTGALVPDFQILFSSILLGLPMDIPLPSSYVTGLPLQCQFLLSLLSVRRQPDVYMSPACLYAAVRQCHCHYLLHRHHLHIMFFIVPPMSLGSFYIFFLWIGFFFIL
jgi:hypothetical protein